MVHIEMERVEGDCGFEGRDADGHVARFDTSVAQGGSGSGIRPMQSMLMALGTCSAADIVSILKKQKQAVHGFRISISGMREEIQSFSLWKTIHVHYQLAGTVEEEKVARACALSLEKYCSVAETLRRAGAVITWQVTVNELQS